MEKPGIIPKASSTMRIFSSAEWCRRVFLRMSRTVFSALSGMRLLACLIVAPRWGYDEPKILSYAISPFCPTSADGLQWPGIRSPAQAAMRRSEELARFLVARSEVPCQPNRERLTILRARKSGAGNPWNREDHDAKGKQIKPFIPAIICRSWSGSNNRQHGGLTLSTRSFRHTHYQLSRCRSGRADLDPSPWICVCP